MSRPPYAPALDGDIGARNLTATDWWLFDAGEMDSALNVIAGTPELIGTVMRIVPLRFVDFPNLLIARRFHCEYVGWDSGAAPPIDAEDNSPTAGGWFGSMRVRIDYESPSYSLTGSDAFVTVAGRSTDRTMFAPSSALATSGGARTAHDPGLIVSGEDMTITQHMIPDPILGYLAPYRSVRRYVNNAAYRGFAAGCLLYQGADYSPGNAINGTRVYDVVHTLQGSDVPWNDEVMPDGTFDEPLLQGTTRRYPYTDFSLLFG